MTEDNYKHSLSGMPEYTVFEGKTVAELCQENGIAESVVRSRLNYGWDIQKALTEPVKEFISKGAKGLLVILREVFPHQKILTEYHVGEGLRLDYYLPSLQIGVEYHGRQHFEMVQHFHGNLDGFYNSKLRDARKIELCDQLGVTLVHYDYRDQLNYDLVKERIMEHLS